MKTDKTNVLKPDDPDLFNAVIEHIRKKLEADDPNYDGSSLVLNPKEEK
jgi:hypothetical protein